MLPFYATAVLTKVFADTWVHRAVGHRGIPAVATVQNLSDIYDASLASMPLLFPWEELHSEVTGAEHTAFRLCV